MTERAEPQTKEGRLMVAAARRYALRMEQGHSRELERRTRALDDREAALSRREQELKARAAALGREERAIYRKDRERVRAALLIIVHKELGHAFHMTESEDGAMTDARIVDAVMAGV